MFNNFPSSFLNLQNPISYFSFYHILVTMESMVKLFHDLESPIVQEQDNAKRELAECFASSE